MNPLRRYPVLSTLLRPFRRSQQKTCAALIVALCQAAQASSFAMITELERDYCQRSDSCNTALHCAVGTMRSL